MDLVLEVTENGVIVPAFHKVYLIVAHHAVFFFLITQGRVLGIFVLSVDEHKGRLNPISGGRTLIQIHGRFKVWIQGGG